MIYNVKHILTVTGLSVVMAASVALPVLAEENSASNNIQATTGQKSRVEVPKTKDRLDDAHKRLCDQRSSTLKQIMNKAAAQGQKNLDTFGRIATRVQEFYVNKKLTVSNYAA